MPNNDACSMRLGVIRGFPRAVQFGRCVCTCYFLACVELIDVMESFRVGCYEGVE